MLRLVRLAFALTLLSVSLSAAAASCFAGSNEGRPLRVLFIGNSLTYYNNMPEMVEAVASANGGSVETGLVASGGATLHDHLSSGDAVRAIKGQRWDYVVLQEQSSFGVTYLLNGEFRARPATRWFDDVERLSSEIRRAGATPVLLAHWPTKEFPADATLIDGLYSRAAARNGACIIRYNPALQMAQKQVGAGALYAEDNLHPRPLASYVKAAAIWRALGGTPLKTVPTSVRGEPIEESEGKRLGGRATLVTVEDGVADNIRTWANAVSNAPLETPLLLPAEPTIPSAAGGASTQALAGNWRGPLRLYPVPATVILEFGKVDGRPVVDVDFEMDGKVERSAENLPVEMTAQGPGFTFPHGPNGTAIKFYGVRDGETLRGVASFRSDDGSLEGIGTWEVKQTTEARP